MGKAIVVLLLIAAAGYFIYDRLGQSPSPEMQQVKNLTKQYEGIVSAFSSAQSRAGLVGDSIFDAGSAAARMVQVRNDLADLRRKLTEDKAIEKANALAEKVEAFCQKNGIQRP